MNRKNDVTKNLDDLQFEQPPTYPYASLKFERSGETCPMAKIFNTKSTPFQQKQPKTSLKTGNNK